MKLSIRMKIFLPVTLILVAFPLAVWLVLNYSLSGHMNYNARRNLEAMIRRTEDIIASYEGSDDSLREDAASEEEERGLLKEFREMMQTIDGETRLMLLGARYRVIYPKNYDGRPEMTQIYSRLLTGTTESGESWKEREIREETIGTGKYLLYYRALDTDDRVRTVILYCPIYDTKPIMNEISRLVLLIIVVMAAVAIVLFWFVAGSISIPVNRLCEAARGIGEKRFKKVETGATVWELCELENEINHMQEKLLQADQAEQTFFQNASHELRTPLMSISGYAQGIQHGVFEDISQAAGVILDESSRLTEVVDGILTLTRMDQLRYQVVPVELGINEFIEDQLERLEGLAYAKAINLVFHPGKEHRIISDAQLLGRAFSNVVSNCVRYAVHEVRVTLREAEEELEITIQDDGPGLKSEELAHLFDRFYKGKSGNHGLGLAIARCSLEYMGGMIKAESSIEGAVFIITLPQDCRSFAVEEWKESW